RRRGFDEPHARGASQILEIERRAREITVVPHVNTLERRIVELCVAAAGRLRRSSGLAQLVELLQAMLVDRFVDDLAARAAEVVGAPSGNREPAVQACGFCERDHRLAWWQ